MVLLPKVVQKAIDQMSDFIGRIAFGVNYHFSKVSEYSK